MQHSLSESATTNAVCLISVLYSSISGVLRGSSVAVDKGLSLCQQSQFAKRRYSMFGFFLFGASACCRLIPNEEKNVTQDSAIKARNFFSAPLFSFIFHLCGTIVSLCRDCWSM